MRALAALAIGLLVSLCGVLGAPSFTRPSAHGPHARIRVSQRDAQRGDRVGSAERISALLSPARRGSALLSSALPAAAQPQWRFDPRARGGHFPIAVWLQAPSRAERYKAAGFNLFVGLWKGPTEEQLAELRKAGMPVICDQNEVGLRHLEDPIIVGWMHGDEPDNAQAKDGGGYGPPIAPEKIVADYVAMRKRDPSRPIMLNLGQGVAFDGWRGRGVRTNHPEDYPEYCKGGDIVSFDIYPVVHRSPEVAGKIEFVGRGIDRLRQWTGGEKHVWNCIECTRISNVEVKPTPDQVRAEVWLSIVHGSRGIVYFVHQFKPRFNEKALLDDAEMLRAVSAVNHRIAELAPVINGEAGEVRVEVAEGGSAGAVHAAARRHRGGTWVFAVNTSGEAREARLEVAGLGGTRTVEVLGEERRLRARGGRFEDAFAPWGVHLYRVR